MTNDKLARLLVKHEGLKLKPYLCPAGKLTIGVGRNLEDRGITEAEAYHLLANDIIDTGHTLFKVLPWVQDLDRVRRAVLLDMAFNMGVAGLLKFKRTLGLVEAGDYQEAAVEMLDSRWANQVGARALELARMMETGLWPDNIARG